MKASVLTAAERDIGGVALLVLIASIAVAAMMSPGALNRESVLASAEVPEYRIVEVRERSAGLLLTVDIVVEGSPGVDGLTAAAAAVVDTLRGERDYSGLRARLYDHETFLHVGDTLGEFIDAPEGQWVRALNPTRDYSRHRTVVKVLEKDWTARPANWQIEAVAALFEQDDHTRPAYSDKPKQVEGGELVVADEDSDLAQRLGLTESEFAEAIEATYAWSDSGVTVETVLE